MAFLISPEEQKMENGDITQAVGSGGHVEKRLNRWHVHCKYKNKTKGISWQATSVKLRVQPSGW
jgi:hypothetical protein